MFVTPHVSLWNLSLFIRSNGTAPQVESSSMKASPCRRCFTFSCRCGRHLPTLWHGSSVERTPVYWASPSNACSTTSGTYTGGRRQCCHTGPLNTCMHRRLHCCRFWVVVNLFGSLIIIVCVPLIVVLNTAVCIVGIATSPATCLLVAVLEYLFTLLIHDFNTPSTSTVVMYISRQLVRQRA